MKAVASLTQISGPDFELCVVCGPTDRTLPELLAPWEGHLTIGFHPTRNIAAARNTGLKLTGGEIVAFIDDDALPEPEWLEQIVAAFDDPAVGAAGGIVMDHTGTQPQYAYVSGDRLGNVDWNIAEARPEFCFPLSFTFPYVQGTNCAFRRSALIDIGGFDEEYEYYLEETDVCCRLVDSGWRVKQLNNAFVHHKFLPSQIRNAQRVTQSFYEIIKSKIYFSLVNNHGHYPERRAVTDAETFVQAHADTLHLHAAQGRVDGRDVARFEKDVPRAWSDGLRRGLTGVRKLPPAANLTGADSSTCSFRRTVSDDRGVFVFISEELPGERNGGIGRHVHQLSRAVAARGHQVHLVTSGDGHDRLDLEDGIWVHRTATREGNPMPPGLDIPQPLWDRAVSVNETVKAISARREITAVHAPIWNCEGVAILLDGVFPLATGLHTSMKSWIDNNPAPSRDPDFVARVARPIIALEQRLLRGSDAIHANSEANAKRMIAEYGVEGIRDRIEVIHHGVDDWSDLPAEPVTRRASHGVRLLFVGRLEFRKGIDILLSLVSGLIGRYPELVLDIVGNDRLDGPDGVPFKDAFLRTAERRGTDRVRFHGEVTDAQLRGFYRDCDIFVCPSRYELFGLVLLEAMMFAKPIVAFRAGAIEEVVGDTALLSELDDVALFRSNIEALIDDAELRERLGHAGRRRYESRFSSASMADAAIALMKTARARKLDQPVPP